MKAASSRGGSARVGSLRFAFQVGIPHEVCTPVVEPQSVGWSRSGQGSFCLPSLIHTLPELALHIGSRIRGHFSGCGKSGRPDILSHIPRIPLGIAGVPGEVCAVFILPSVALNPTAVHQEGREKPNV